MTKEQKKYNRELNRLRGAVEHVNPRLKIFKILSYRYRNRHSKFGLRANLIAGIYNYEVGGWDGWVDPQNPSSISKSIVPNIIDCCFGIIQG